MDLTKTQIAFISEIRNGQLRDIFDLFKSNSALLQHSLRIRFKDLDGEYSTNYIPNDSKKLLMDLKEYIALWEKLENANLCKSIPRQSITSDSINLIAKKENSNYSLVYDFIPIIYEYKDKQLFPLEDLNKFVDNKYFTYEEIQKDTEFAYMKKNFEITKKAQNTTKLIAIVSIILNIFSILVGIYFYSTNRTVSILNPNAFKDTTHVILLNNAKQKDTTSNKIDSLLYK